MDISLSFPIAEGRTADIFAWQDHFILKLYRDWCPADWVENEWKVARAVVAAGVPAPAVGDLLEVNGRRGLVYERLSGVTMLRDMNARPWMLLRHARTLAELQARINRLSIPGLPSYKSSLMYTIRRAPHLDETLREKALRHLDTLRDGEKVCHADFHPDNVLITEKGPIVIDWMTACSGNPWADVARTNMILLVGAKAAGRQLRPHVRFLIDLYRRSYLGRYRSIMPDAHGELAQWLPVVAAARLDERIDPECEALIGMVADGLSG